jgi:SAM-dependent methyltransferase
MATDHRLPLGSQLRNALARHPTLKASVKRLIGPFRRSTSGGYQPLSGDRQAATVDALKDAWLDAAIPARQRAGVDQALSDYRAGTPMLEFDVLVGQLRPLADGVPGAALLEVGCSSGYHADVLAARGIDMVYRGCDFSPAFVEMARRYHPELHFDVEDATALNYADRSFDVVVSGCCLLHIPKYERAIAETARVARGHALFHRTPVLARRATRFFTKQAYGVKTVEIHFNEAELVALFHANGLRVIAIETTTADWLDGDAFAMKTYLCEKKEAR